MNESADLEVKVIPVILERHSPRSFNPDRPLGRELVMSLLEAARWAPSSGNSQPWFYIVFDGTVPESLEKARESLDDGNRVWAGQAPVLLLACSRVTRKNGKPQRYGEHDLGLANENLLLQATSMGLHVHPMAGFDKKRAREEFSIPESYQPMVMIAVGYPGDLDDLPEDLREREVKPRERKPLDRIVSWGEWRR